MVLEAQIRALGLQRFFLAQGQYYLIFILNVSLGLLWRESIGGWPGHRGNWGTREEGIVAMQVSGGGSPGPSESI